MILPIDMWVLQQVVGLLLFVGLVAWQSRQKIPWPFVLAFLFYATQGILTGQILSVLQLLSFYVGYMILPARYVRWILYFLVCFLILDGFWFVYAWAKPPPWGDNFGFFNATTFDSSIMAILLPGLMFAPRHRVREIAIGLLLFFILFLKGSTGIIGAGAVILIWAASKKDWEIMGAAALVAYFVGAFFWEHLFDSSGRMELYLTHFKWWTEHANHWFGTGLGSFDIIGAVIPSVVPGTDIATGYRFMHSDFLSMIFETGRIGGAIFIGVWAYVFWCARKNAMTLAFVTAYFLASLTYFPLRFFLSQLLALCILKIIFDQQGATYVRMRKLHQDIHYAKALLRHLFGKSEAVEKTSV